MKYKYVIPNHMDTPKGAKHIGVVGTKKIIVSNEEIKSFEKYLVQVIGKVEKEEKKEIKEVESIVSYTEEELKKKPYREVQKIAKELGLKYKGKKVEIISRIVNATRNKD